MFSKWNWGGKNAYGTFLLSKIPTFQQRAAGSLEYHITERLIRTADQLGMRPGLPVVGVTADRLNMLENHIRYSDEIPAYNEDSLCCCSVHSWQITNLSVELNNVRNIFLHGIRLPGHRGAGVYPEPGWN